MLQITRSGFVQHTSSQEEAEWSARFRRQHYVRIPQLLETGLLALVQRHIEQASFYVRAHCDIGTELCMAKNHVDGLLHLLINNPLLFQAVEGICGCGEIGCFSGRVYRMLAGGSHYDSWHDDDGEGRLIGMSINLSSEVYAGGVFQLRDRQTGRILCEAPNTGFGDAIIFPLGREFQHRVTPMQGAAPKTAFAGWFQSRPDCKPWIAARNFNWSSLAQA